MVFILRHLFGLIVHFAVGTAVVIVVCCGFAFYDHGMDYRHTPQFAEQLHDFVRIGLFGGGLYALVIVCYKTTRGVLDPPPPPRDDTLF